MRLIGVATNQLKVLKKRPLLLIAACGYEPRCIALLRSFSGSTLRGVALEFVEHADDSTHGENARQLREAGLTLRRSSGSDRVVAGSVIAEALSPCSGVDILVDLSSMTRVWYGEFVRHLRDSTCHEERMVHFMYFPGKYPATALPKLQNEVAEPIPGFVGFEPPDLPIALLAGVGYDREQVDGLVHHLEPKRAVFFSTGPRKASNESREDAERFKWPVGIAEFVRYNLSDPGGTLHNLEAMAYGLSDGFRVVACSLGPKLFGLLCFLAAALRPELSVWRFSPGMRQAPVYVRAATHEPIVCSTRWR